MSSHIREQHTAEDTGMHNIDQCKYVSHCDFNSMKDDKGCSCISDKEKSAAWSTSSRKQNVKQKFLYLQ